MAEATERATRPAVQAAGWDPWAEEELRSYPHLHPWQDRVLGVVEGVGWALLVEGVETLWDRLLLAAVAAMAAGAETVAPAEERVPGRVVATP